MPITPFHFGPGALLHAAAPRHVSFLAFCAANVLIDVESLYSLVNHRLPVHAFLHTYIGSTLVVLAIAASFVALRQLASHRLPGLRTLRELNFRQVLVGAALGAYSHVALDSLMHHDIQPLAPLSTTNSFLGVVSLSTLHWSCLVAGAVGLVVLGVRKVIAGEESAA
jgi:membrane-bound metal-dependent hydrolase YbcI (DUF457 family)